MNSADQRVFGDRPTRTRAVFLVVGSLLAGGALGVLAFRVRHDAASSGASLVAAGAGLDCFVLVGTAALAAVFALREPGNKRWFAPGLMLLAMSRGAFAMVVHPGLALISGLALCLLFFACARRMGRVALACIVLCAALSVAVRVQSPPEPVHGVPG